MIKYTTWLRDTIGFSVGDPLATFIADYEREMLEDKLFVAVDQYERIQNADSILVFAGRGEGKSAIRIRLYGLGINGRGRQKVLMVEYTDFGWLLGIYNQNQVVTAYDHTEYLLRCALETLFDSLFLQKDTYFHKIRNTSLVQNLGTQTKIHLSYFFRQYATILLRRHAIDIIQPLSNSEIDYGYLQQCIDTGEVKSLLAFYEISEKHLFAHLFADLCDLGDQHIKDPFNSPIKEFEKFIKAINALGIHKLHFIIDRLDEMPELANNVIAQVDLIEALLSYTRLLETKNLGFKFLLTEETKSEILNRSKIRHDRFRAISVQLRWYNHDLHQLIETRFAHYSGDKIIGFAQICQSDDRKKIETALFNFAQNSPRRLLQGLRAIFLACYESEQKKYPFTYDHWIQARESLLMEGNNNPILYIYWKEKRCYIGNQVISLTRNESDIFHCLLKHDGYCSINSLEQEVWKNAASRNTVQQAVRRLRKKIEMNVEAPIYLITVSGGGYRLKFAVDGELVSR